MKLTKKKLSLLLGCLFCTAVLSTVGALTGHAEEGKDGVLSPNVPLRIVGSIQKENGRVIMTDIHGDTAMSDLVLNLSGDTLILDAVNGFPVSADDLQDGEIAYAYVSQAMTLSLPPQTHAEVILCKIPADFAAPAYEFVETLSQNADGSYILTTARGTQYLVDSGCALLPHLTRNIVTIQDLVKGRRILVWTNPRKSTATMDTAYKIVMFSMAKSAEEPTGPASDPELIALRR